MIWMLETIEFLRKLNGEKTLFAVIIGVVILVWQVGEVADSVEKIDEKLTAWVDTSRAISSAVKEHLTYQEVLQLERLDTLKARQDRMGRALRKIDRHFE